MALQASSDSEFELVSNDDSIDFEELNGSQIENIPLSEWKDSDEILKMTYQQLNACLHRYKVKCTGPIEVKQ